MSLLAHLSYSAWQATVKISLTYLYATILAWQTQQHNSSEMGNQIFTNWCQRICHGKQSTSFSKLDSFFSVSFPSSSVFLLYLAAVPGKQTHTPSCSEQAKSSWFNPCQLLSRGKSWHQTLFIFLSLDKPEYPGKIQELLRLSSSFLLPLNIWWLSFSKAPCWPTEGTGCLSD